MAKQTIFGFDEYYKSYFESFYQKSDTLSNAVCFIEIHILRQDEIDMFHPMKFHTDGHSLPEQYSLLHQDLILSLIIIFEFIT